MPAVIVALLALLGREAEEVEGIVFTVDEIAKIPLFSALEQE